MRVVLLGAVALAAVAVFAAPAGAQRSADARFAAGPSAGFSQSGGMPTVHRNFGRDHHHRDRHDRDRFDRRGHRGDGTVVVGSWYQSRDWDGNRSFDPDKWNDWWHERPWRSYPAWVARNQNCERLWWSGGGWRC